MSLTCHVAWAVFTHPGFSHPICKGAVGAQPLGSLALSLLENTLAELLPAADPPCPTEAPSGLDGLMVEQSASLGRPEPPAQVTAGEEGTEPSGSGSRRVRLKRVHQAESLGSWRDPHSSQGPCPTTRAGDSGACSGPRGGVDAVAGRGLAERGHGAGCSHQGCQAAFQGACRFSSPDSHSRGSGPRGSAGRPQTTPSMSCFWFCLCSLSALFFGLPSLKARRPRPPLQTR